jgi:Flp pilus assembly pilin Flp
MIKTIRRLIRDECGVAGVEYGLLVVLISMGFLVAMKVLGQEFSAILNIIAESINGVL